MGRSRSGDALRLERWVADRGAARMAQGTCTYALCTGLIPAILLLP